MHGVVPAVVLPPLFDDETSSYEPTTIFNDTYTTVTVPDTITVQVAPPNTPFVDATQHESWVADWDSYVGQTNVKNEIQTFIDEAFCDCTVLPHIMLASGMPGVGKTTLARLIAKEMDARLLTIKAPYSVQALQEAILSMNEGEFLFLDEIHELGKSTALVGVLLTSMEEGVLYVDGQRHVLPPFTFIGATTNANRLPETILDRFEVKPIFDPYSPSDMVRIVKNFCVGMDVVLSPNVMVAIAKASRSTPRISRELVKGARALQKQLGRDVTPEELLTFKGYEPNGIMRNHKRYLTSILDNGGRQTPQGYIYAAGEATLMSLLREDKPGVLRLERHLLDLGYVIMTRQGRQLTELGLHAARQYKREGERV